MFWAMLAETKLQWTPQPTVEKLKLSITALSPVEFEAAKVPQVWPPVTYLVTKWVQSESLPG
jgi:hypothetical protein